MATLNTTKTPLTDAAVAALKPRDKIYTLSDPLCRGLHVRVEKSGNKSWWLNVWTPEGAPKRQRYAWRLGDVETFKLYRDDAGMHRKAITEATSSGSAMRPTSVARLMAATPSSPIASSIGVFTGPGAIALTRTPVGAHSLARNWVRLLTPAFVME